ncbi:putative bifunctional proline dehydrogenase/pyrroline-5-carboxylate dehydrogenase [Neisseria polysaccharea ATCC 43768]|nr:putative bifunctional proline dehydrogenase/pyrroline-5-carboxylate dehydrogenase [Neisseria polysaccharea ATCC 43768]
MPCWFPCSTKNLRAKSKNALKKPTQITAPPDKPLSDGTASRFVPSEPVSGSNTNKPCLHTGLICVLPVSFSKKRKHLPCPHLKPCISSADLLRYYRIQAAPMPPAPRKTLENPKNVSFCISGTNCPAPSDNRCLPP